MKRQLCLAMLVAIAFACQANAELRNRYSFNDGTANDSVGGANGTLFGTNGSISGGQLVLANDTGISSENPGDAGAYLDLPSGLVSSAASVGGAVTVEMWLTINENRDWASAFSAGISSGGDGISSGGNGDQPYIQVIPRAGASGAFRVTSNSTAAGEGDVDDTDDGNGTDLVPGEQEHLVSVFDQSGGLPGTLTVYRNGELMGSDAISANLDLTTFFRGDNTGGDVNNWVGRSQWPDSLLWGSVDELRIYDNALSASAASINFQAGPNTVIPEPASALIASVALLGGIGRRRSRCE